MKNNIKRLKALAITGSVLAFLPLLATILTGLIHSIAVRRLRVDYLIPAEHGLIAIIAGVLLLSVAILSRIYQKTIIIFSLMLLGSQGLAVVTGLASGAREATGWPFVVVIGTLILYALLMVVLGLAGIKLTCALSNIKQSTQ